MTELKLTTNINDINNPFYIYPCAPCAGFPPSPLFRSELIRLSNFLRYIGLFHNLLFNMSPGTPLINESDEKLKQRNCEWKLCQSCPDHLIRASKKGITCINIIVTPDVINHPILDFLSDFTYVTNTNNKHYQHKIFPFSIYFFSTMLPTNDKKRNDAFLIQINKPEFTNHIPDIVNIYKQTDNDRNFINHFYDILNRTVTNIGANGGFSSFISFAVFNETSIENYKYNQCNMFKEILKCFPDSSTSFIYEWVFKYDCYVVYNINHNSKYPKIISFVPSTYIMDNKTDFKCEILRPFINQFGKIDFTHKLLINTYEKPQISPLVDGAHAKCGKKCCECNIESKNVKCNKCNIESNNVKYNKCNKCNIELNNVKCCKCNIESNSPAFSAGAPYRGEIKKML